jgi:hypothetical protein
MFCSNARSAAEDAYSRCESPEKAGIQKEISTLSKSKPEAKNVDREKGDVSPCRS